MTRVLVTGAGGFLGRPTVDALLHEGFEVHGTGRAVPASPEPGVTWHAADLLEPGAAEEVIAAAAADHLVHLAWDVTPGAYWTSGANVTWVEASLRLVRAHAAAGGSSVVVAGTAAEGASTSPYAMAKSGLRDVLLGGADPLGLAVVWARVFQPYGPGEDARRLLPDVARRLLAGEAVPVTDGIQVRDFVHAADVGRAFAALVGRTTGCVDVGTGHGRRVVDVVRALEALIDRGRLDVGALERPSHEPLSLVADPTALHDLGWHPEVDLQAGLHELVDGVVARG